MVYLTLLVAVKVCEDHHFIHKINFFFVVDVNLKQHLTQKLLKAVV